MRKMILVKRRERLSNPANFGRPRYGPWKSIAQARTVEIAREVARGLITGSQYQDALFQGGTRLEFVNES